MKKPKYVYMLRTCTEDMKGYGGFKWPKKGPVKCDDWNTKPVCGGGLHGLLWGEGTHAYLSEIDDAMWLVVKVLAIDVVYISEKGGGKWKYSKGEVCFAGTREKAIGFLKRHTPSNLLDRSIGFQSNGSKHMVSILKALGREFKQWPTLFLMENTAVSAAGFSEENSYGRGMGFDYSSHISPAERRYVYSVAEEVALALNSKKPFFIYDGNEKIKFPPKKRSFQARDKDHSFLYPEVSCKELKLIESECLRLKEIFKVIKKGKTDAAKTAESLESIANKRQVR